MGNFISKIFKSSILGSIGLIVLGMLLVFQSEATIISISYIIGGILVAIGALAILRFIKNAKEKGKRD